MLLRKRRLTEEWNLDLSGDSRDSRPTLVEKMRADAKIWAVVALAAAAVCVLLVLSASRMDKPRDYTEFEGQLRIAGAGVVTECHYDSADGTMHVTVPSETDPGELRSVLRSAAVATLMPPGSHSRFGRILARAKRLISKPFGAIPDVRVYIESDIQGPAELDSAWEWSHKLRTFVPTRVRRA